MQSGLSQYDSGLGGRSKRHSAEGPDERYYPDVLDDAQRAAFLAGGWVERVEEIVNIRLQNILHLISTDKLSYTSFDTVTAHGNTIPHTDRTFIHK